jgi:sucrose synthase
MPDLYRVVDGVNARHTKFNIVSPGVNEDVHFPPSEKDKRVQEITESLTALLLENKEDDKAFGQFENKEKRIIFSMSRLDKIKNITGLIRWFGESKELQERANLLICAGKINADESGDNEEKEQINIIRDYINKYNLHNKIRWIGRALRKDEAGEAYRLIAEKRGIFVQPALFEGFGLTVIEAMATGLPVFATKYGGPLEIIQDKKNGFHIDPAHDRESTNVLLEFLRKVDDDPGYWEEISNSAVQRVKEKYNWELYSERLLSQAKIYGFWKYSTDMENRGMKAYLDLLYHTVFKPRAKKLLEEHNKR